MQTYDVIVVGVGSMGGAAANELAGGACRCSGWRRYGSPPRFTSAVPYER